MRVILTVTLCILLITIACSEEKRDYYQIKIFTLADEYQEMRMDKYLKDAYIPALNRAGIEHVGVFKPIEEDTAFIYLSTPVDKEKYTNAKWGFNLLNGYTIEQHKMVSSSEGNHITMTTESIDKKIGSHIVTLEFNVEAIFST